MLATKKKKKKHFKEVFILCDPFIFLQLTSEDSEDHVWPSHPLNLIYITNTRSCYGYITNRPGQKSQYNTEEPIQ